MPASACSGHGLLLCVSIVCCCCLLPHQAGPSSSDAPTSAKPRRPTSCDNIGGGGGSGGGGVRSFLWSTRGEPASYFFGTIHVPYTRVWDHVPENAKRAFGNADRVVFELDLLDPGTLAALANCQLLPEGRSLADVLPAELLARLRRHLEYVRAKMSSWMTADQRGRGLYADYLFHAITGDWERKRPIWVLLMVDSLTEGDVRARGVPVLDLFLAQEAQRLAKRTGAVEQVHEQCLPLNGLNFSQVLFALDQTLRQHERIRRGAQRSGGYNADDLIRHYNCGDLDAVVFSRDSAQVPPLANTSLRLSARELRLARDIDRYFRQELIYKRNHRMGDRVLRLLRANPGQSFFFAFGAGHFLGNNTVLDFVRQGGFDIEHIMATRSIPEVKKGGGEQSSWPDPSEVLGDQQQSASEQTGGWRRKKPKKRPFSQASSPTTARPRKFNDLWVRLDTTWRPRSLPPQQRALGARDSAPAVHESFKLWRGYKARAAASATAHRDVPPKWIVICLGFATALWKQLATNHFPP